jgi:outer membrane cobalamin receptor
MRKLKILCILSFISGFLDAQNVDSINAGDTLMSHDLAEVVISANRFNSLGLNTPEAIRVLNSTTVQEFQLRTSPEALLLTPGVFVQKTNHGGGSPFIRGLTGNQTLLLIDGIRLSNSTMRYGPNQYFNTIDIFSIDRMEILRGSGSVQYGSDGLGGTIQAFSHELINSEKSDWGGNVIARIATQGMEQSFNSGINYSNKSAAFRAGLTLRNFGDLVGGDTTGRQSPSGYSEQDYDFKGKIVISPKTILTMVWQSVHQKAVPQYYKIELENYAVNVTDPQKRKLGYVRLNRELDAGALKSVILTASYQHTDEGRESRKNGSDIMRNEFDKVRGFGLSAEAIVSNRDSWSGNIGLEIYNDLVNSSRTDTELATGTETDLRGLYPNGSTMSSFALFTVHSFDLPKWNITTGARLNSFIINVQDEELGSVKLTPAAVVGNMSILRKLNPESNLFVSFNTGFRAPNIDDLGTLGIVDFRYEIPNYDLKPESSFQYQAGYKFSGKKLRGDLFFYRNELYNLITRVKLEDETIEGYPVYQKENSERAYIQGIETAWDFKLNRSFTLNGTLTYTYGQNISKDEPVRRIPPLFGRIAVEYRYKNIWLNIEWLVAGKQDRLAQGDIDDNRIPEGGTPGWNIINLNSGYRWKFLAIDLIFKNLFNIDYRYHGSGINSYGRSLFLTMTVNF